MKIKPHFTKNRQFTKINYEKIIERFCCAKLGILRVRSRARPKPVRLRDSSTCGAVPERSEGMSREDGEVRIARRWRRSETKPTPETPEIYSVLRCPAVLFLTIRYYSAENGVLRKY